MTFGSLFSGLGGFDLGFTRAGMTCRWQVENNPHCVSVLARHYPNVRRHDDIRTFHPDESHRVDIIVGGDPCQENSGARTHGECSQPSLGGEFIRVVDALRPRLVLRENPKHIRRDAPWPWWRMRSAFESLGYVVLPFRLRACCLGAKHQRDRLFLLAEYADANGDGLEGWAESTAPRLCVVPAGLVDVHAWEPIPAHRGHRSRAGIPRYVERMKALGNAVTPQQAEWIARNILNAA